MILGILEKIRNRKYDFTEEELPFVRGYLSEIIEKMPPDKLQFVVEKSAPVDIATILPHIVPDLVESFRKCPPEKLKKILEANDYVLIRQLHREAKRREERAPNVGANYTILEGLLEIVQAKLGQDYAEDLLLLKDASAPLGTIDFAFAPFLETARKLGGSEFAEKILTKNDSEVFCKICKKTGNIYRVLEAISAVTGTKYPDRFFGAKAREFSQEAIATFPLIQKLFLARNGEAFQELCRKDWDTKEWLWNFAQKTGNEEFPLQLLKSGEDKLLIHFLEGISAKYDNTGHDYVLPTWHEDEELPEFIRYVQETCGRETLDTMLTADNFAVFRHAHYLSNYDNKKGYADTEPEDIIHSFALKSILAAASESPDKTLAGRMCAANHDLIENMWDKKGGREQVKLVFDRLNEENCKILIAAMSPIWQEQFRDKKPDSETLSNKKTIRLLTRSTTAQKWRAVLNMEPPTPTLGQHSPLGFKPELYNEVLPSMITQLELSHVNGSLGPQGEAYKLAVLFSNRQEVERYFDNFAKRQNWNKGNLRDIVHDALLFEVPREGEWTIPKWKDLVLKYGPAVSKYLALAPKIETYANEHDLPFPTKPKEVLELATMVAYERAGENKEFASLALEQGLSEDGFNTALEALKNSKTTDCLPDITIDGAEIGHPSFYMQKLPAGDPVGFVLGKITNCCQHLDGAGKECTLHGMQSPNGGLYVWKHKTGGRRTEYDPIVAQSWAWRGTDNSIVFDSFERLGPTYDKLAKDFLEQFAHETVGEHSMGALEDAPTVTAVKLGTGGKSPKDFIQTAASQPIDYPGYRDSLAQYGVDAVNHKGKAVSQVEKLGIKLRTGFSAEL